MWWMQIEEEDLDGKLRYTDPCIVITTTSSPGVIFVYTFLGVLIVEIDTRRPSIRWNADSQFEALHVLQTNKSWPKLLPKL